MYFVVTDNGVERHVNLQLLNKKLGTIIEETEFKRMGNDRILLMTKEDISFVQDKKKISDIPIKKLFKGDKTELLLYIVIFVEFILLIKG